MSDPHSDFNPDRIPLAYFITFRAHGTWLHGDSRGSIDRFRNRYGTPRIPPDVRWHRYNEQTLKLTQLNSIPNGEHQSIKPFRKLAKSADGSCGLET